MRIEDEIKQLSLRLRALEDEAAIRRLMAEMMHTADDRADPNWGERMASFYTEDGQWTSGAGFADVGMAERGKAALVKKFKAGTTIRESSHLLGTESISVSGDDASGSWLCFEPATLAGRNDTQEAVWIMGRYVCEFRRTDQIWRVRTVRYDGIFCTPYAKGWTIERFKSIKPMSTK